MSARRRNGRQILAASFIVTFTAIPACQESMQQPPTNPPSPNPTAVPTDATPSPTGTTPTATSGNPEPAFHGPHMNPPAPQPTPSTTAMTPPINPPQPVPSGIASGNPSAQLPPAPNGGRIEKQADGSCMWYADVKCPKPPATCNPPAPHKVQCPNP